MILSANASFSSAEPSFLAMVDSPDLQRRAPPHNRCTFIPDRQKTLCIERPDRMLRVSIPDELGYLAPGDILRVDPTERRVRILFRRQSRHNFLFFTDRCNSRCLMCSQPPKEVADDHLVSEILEFLPWISPDARSLGITGGEPTLSRGRLVEVIALAQKHLPATALHLLSNGRLFTYPKFAAGIGAVRHPDLMIGIPLYGDTASLHDFVVQSTGAFDQTLRGLVNLATADVATEIRIVVHRQTLPRLKELCRFVGRNLSFASQVVLMGLEPTGYARSNWSALWIDPIDYAKDLEIAVEELESRGMDVRIYNHPLCVLPSHLRHLATQSIADWKNIFLSQCDRCSAKDKCCGFFASAEQRHSQAINPI